MDNKTLKDNWQTYAAKPSRWHNAFHLEMPIGLVNDPNGLCYYQGKYQLFYQWNPFGCEHKHKHWAYTQTADFIHYTIPQIALAPVDDFDKDGCYSGSARVHNGRLELFYTANLKDEHNVRRPRQVLAVKNQDGSFQKQKILIDDVPQGYTAHFRDPYLFVRGNRSFMILGAQRENLTGCTLIYEEVSEGSWQFRGELKTQYTDFGYMWECPNLLTVDGYDVLVFCPQGLSAQGYKYNNLYQAGYLIGRFNPDTLEFAHGKFKELDGGFDFYAPQILTHGKQNILIGWVGMPEREAEYPTSEEGWLHSLTLPRKLQLKNGRIYQMPVPELAALCKIQTAVSDLQQLSTPCKIELKIDLTNRVSWQGSFKMGNDELTLSYVVKTQEFCIDRTGMTLGGKGKRVFTVAADDTLNVIIYVDNSIMEIYCQDGQACATVCYYVQQNDFKLQFKTELAAADSAEAVRLDNFKFS